MKQTYYLLLTFLLVSSCQRSDTPPVFMGKRPTFIEFDKTVELAGELLPVEVFAADNIYVIDTLLIFTTPALGTLYHAVSFRDYTYTRSFIAKGEGPNEFDNALPPLTAAKKEGNLLLSFYHQARQGLFHYNLTESFLQGTDIFQDTVALGKLTEIYRAYQINEDKVFVDKMDFININQQYSIYDRKHQQLLHNDNAIISGLKSHGDTYLLATNTIFNKSNLKYASAMRFADQVNIYDLANPENSLTVSNSDEPTSLVGASRTLMPFKKEYYVDLRETNNLLFGLYANLGRKEWANGDSPATIHVIDWKGNPICKLSTQEKLVKFDIDPENNILYGLTEKQEVYKYDLHQIPKSKDKAIF